MFRNWKKQLRAIVATVSVANGYWAFQTQTIDGQPNWSPVVMALASAWVFYFSIVWLLEGMRSK